MRFVRKHKLRRACIPTSLRLQTVIVFAVLLVLGQALLGQGQGTAPQTYSFTEDPGFPDGGPQRGEGSPRWLQRNCGTDDASGGRDAIRNITAVDCMTSRLTSSISKF